MNATANSLGFYFWKNRILWSSHKTQQNINYCEIVILVWDPSIDDCFRMHFIHKRNWTCLIHFVCASYLYVRSVINAAVDFWTIVFPTILFDKNRLIQATIKLFLLSSSYSFLFWFEWTIPRKVREFRKISTKPFKIRFQIFQINLLHWSF